MQSPDKNSLNQSSQQLKPFSEKLLSSEINKSATRSDQLNISSEQPKSPIIKYGATQPSQEQLMSPDAPEIEQASQQTRIICKEIILEGTPDVSPQLDKEDSPQLQQQEEAKGHASPRFKPISQYPSEKPNLLLRNRNEAQQNAKRKKKVAKDDTMQDHLRWKTNLKSSFEGVRNNFFEQNEGKSPNSPTRQNIFTIDRSMKEGQTTSRKVKRKMSASQLNFQEQMMMKPNFEEESDDGFDLTQSLMTLQLKNPHRPPLKQQSMVFDQWGKQKKVENNLRGIGNPAYRESAYRKNSNIAGASDIQSHQDSDSDSQVREIKSNADNQDEEDESVQLNDPDLEGIGRIQMNSHGSSKGISTNIQNAIEQIEIDEVDSAKSNAPELNQIEEDPHPEEYESLVWGQSIWSTDVPKESRKQFIQNINTLAVTQEEENKNEITNDEDDFAAIQKKIQEQANAQEQVVQPQQAIQPEQTISQENPYVQPDSKQNVQMIQSFQQYNDYTEQSQQPQYQQYHDHQQMRRQSFAIQGQPEEFQHPNQYQNIDQTSQQFNCGNSVHSGGHLSFPGHHQMGVYNVAPDYNADANSSNFTHHPYSQYGQPQSSQPFSNGNNIQQNQQNGGAVFNNQNRAHIFLNRQINKYMMNPIYKSGQTVASLQMHRYAGIPWRGGTSNPNAFHQLQQKGSAENFQNVQQQNDPVESQYMPENMTENSPKDSYTQQLQYMEQKEAENLQQPYNTLSAQPFYPKNYGDDKVQRKQHTINESANILAAGKMPNFRQKATPAIHVPIPIPMVGAQKKPRGPLKQPQKQDHQESSIFMTNFYRQDVIMKKNELDKRMQETTQNLESKLIKAVQINDEEDNDDDEEEDLTFEVVSNNEVSDLGANVSVERPDSILNKSINIKELKHHLGGTQQINFRNLNRHRKNSGNDEIKELKENKIKQFEEKIKRKNDRAAIFSKLQAQLSEFKTEMSTPIEVQLGNNTSSSVSPKRSSNTRDLLVNSKLTPFRPDAKQYMDKVLHLMNIINEVDDLTNVAELKNKLEKQKLQLLKARAERDEVVNQLQYLQQTHRTTEYEFREKEKKYQLQQNESTSIIQSLQQSLIQNGENSDQQIFSLRQKLSDFEQLRQESQTLMVQNTQLQESQSIQEQTIFNQHNQIGQLNNQIEQINHNNYQLTSTLNQLQQENSKLQQDIQSMEKEWVRKTDIKKKSSSDGEEDDDDDDDVPLHEQLKNANQQIKDLQEYIKKRGFEDLKNNQLRKEVIHQSEAAHQDKYLKLKQSKEEMEREKDKIIQRLKDFIINHNEPMLIGSCGSSMFGQSEERKVDQHARINDESTIEAQSMVSFDNNDHDDYIKLIMNDYNCGRCEEKDKILKANEERINEFKAYIKKQGAQKPVKESVVYVESSSSIVQNTSSNNSLDKSGGNLRSCHKILLSNYIRQFRVYLDNLDEEETEKTSQMQAKISAVAEKQKITLFHEEEDPDTSLVTKELIQEIMSMSLDMINDLLDYGKDETPPTQVFKTIEFGLNQEQLKEMQNVARAERKQCHQIIVEIEKLMYDMNNLIGSIPDNKAVQIFGQILDTYLQLPHRLKPIFDHCKKIENVAIKALKSQEAIVKTGEKQ